MEKVAFALFNDSESSDVVIECTNDDAKTIFHCHKFILSMSSPGLEAMFRHEGFKENEENVVEMTDFGAKAIEMFLRAAYGDTEFKGMTSEVAKEAIRVCDKYDLQTALKANLENYIIRTFLVRTRDSADFAVLGHEKQFSNLKTEAIRKLTTWFELNKLKDLEPLRGSSDVLFEVFGIVAEKLEHEAFSARCKGEQRVDKQVRHTAEVVDSMQKNATAALNRQIAALEALRDHVQQCAVCSKKGTAKCPNISRLYETPKK